MIIFFFFLTPLLAYFVIRRLVSSAHLAIVSPFYAVLIGLLSVLTVLGVYRFSGHFPEGTQVAWTGVETSGNSLRIGGVREEALVGWANNLFTPSLQISTLNNMATLVIEGGAAFFFDESRKVFLNGMPLAPDETKVLDGFTVRFKGQGWNPFGQDIIEILEDNRPVASFELPSSNPHRDRVFSVRAFVERHGTSSAEDAARLLKVGRWAEDKRLLVAGNGEVRLLGAERSQAQCALPCRLAALWINQRLPLEMSTAGSKLTLKFLPPWRIVSPLPPRGADGNRKMIITGEARPGDVAFALPLGHAVEDPRRTLGFGADAAAMPVFTGPGVTLGNGVAPPKDYLPPGLERTDQTEETAARPRSVTSRVAVPLGASSLLLATINDLPRPGGIALLLGAAFACYAVGIFLTARQLPVGMTRWTFFGLVSFIWSILSFRLLLALRFALAPNYMDAHALKGVMLAFIALTITPGLIMLWVRLRLKLIARLAAAQEETAQAQGRQSGSGRPGLISSLLYLLMLLAASWIQYHYVPMLWPDLPARFIPTLSWKFTLPILLILCYLALVIVILYRTGLRHTRLRGLHALFLGPLRFDVWLSRMGQRLWTKILTDPPVSGPRMVVYLFFFFVFFGLVPLSVPFVTRLFSLQDLLKDIFAPFALCLVPALLWLTSKLRLSPEGARPAVRRLIILAGLTIFLPVLFIPVLMRDAGSVLALLSILFPLTALLLAARLWRVGGAALLTLAIMFLCAGYVYNNLLSFLPLLPGEAEVRLFTFREGTQVERFFAFADATNSGQGLSLQKLRDAYQHTWENYAIAHEGGWFGVGYGHAPTRLSQVRQDTIQFDSLYSFFIASEYGFFGGASLLLLYALPLLLILDGGWQRREFDFGLASAIIIVSSFLLEAILHAGMNMGAFPFTGRGMPLLSVDSVSDLLRWMILFGFAAQLLLWRETNEVLSPVPTTTAHAPDTDKDSQQHHDARRRLAIPAAALLIPGLLAACVVWANFKVIRDSSLEQPFEWRGVLNRVGRMIADQVIVFDQTQKTLSINRTALDVPDGSLIEQEILRFNALPLEERLNGSTAGDFSDRLRRVVSVSAYNGLLDDLRKEEMAMRRDNRPSLFRLLPPARWTDGAFTEERGGYRVVPNAEFNIRLSFRAGRQPDELPHVSFRDRQGLIVGPAWVGGRWMAAYDPDHAPSWIRQLAKALDVEWGRLGAKEAARRYSTITLDRSLHEAAMEFTARKGREAYRAGFDRGGSTLQNTADMTPLPPRVALSVITLPRGEVLALGGYPHMTAHEYWRKIDGDWLPPANWIETAAPRQLRTLYGSDRNFDPLVVGSATKPLWASAVLGVHANLDQQLTVRGAGGSESDVFGIPLTRSWQVTLRPNWLSFANYLGYSDNRYHVRLGFLGLAMRAGNTIATGGDSNSDRESLNGGRSPWRKVPQFDPQTLFGAAAPTRLANLAATPLAGHLESMYSIGVGKKNFGTRRSFWTKNGMDDEDTAPNTIQASSGQAKRTPNDLFKFISPAIVNLNLDAITNPRDYISLLLGGGTNLWSNVELAAAFGTCLSGNSVVAHMIRNEDKIELSPDRERFPQIAARLRPGLASVVSSGTATDNLRVSIPQETINALTYLNSLRGYKVYAKTGTLREQAGTRDMSRIVLAIVRWENEDAGVIRQGLVFSLVSEQAEKGAATRWLGEFIVRNRASIERLLAEQQR